MTVSTPIFTPTRAVRPCRSRAAPDAPVAPRRAFLASVAVALGVWPTTRASAEVATRPEVEGAAVLSTREAAVISAYDQASPSVVNIVDAARAGARPMQAEAGVSEGNGSGVVWAERDGGYVVVTNFHVLPSLQGAGPDAARRRPVVAQVSVLTTAGRSETYRGTLLGFDRSRDLAVLLIPAPPGSLRSVQLSPRPARVGQQVLAIGNPFGFERTLTVGVVSAVDRDIASPTGQRIVGGIQTDAAINPGNSGGALLDTAGQLIGINTAIFTTSGTFSGVGFALPVTAIAKPVEQLIERGEVVRPSLGIQAARPNIARQLGVQSGVLIQAVQPGSPAATAGLLPTRRSLSGILAGDVLTAIETSEGVFATPTEIALDKALDGLSRGSKVKVRVTRTNEGQQTTELSLDVSL